MAIWLTVVFCEHIPIHRANSMSQTLDLCGIAVRGESARKWRVEIARPKHLSYVEGVLSGWERWAFIRWTKSDVLDPSERADQP
jgi:hypothetical protein